MRSAEVLRERDARRAGHAERSAASRRSRARSRAAGRSRRACAPRSRRPGRPGPSIGDCGVVDDADLHDVGDRDRRDVERAVVRIGDEHAVDRGSLTSPLRAPRMSTLKPPRPASRTVTSGSSASAVARSVAPRAASCSPVSRTSVSRSNGLSGRSSKISIVSPCESLTRSSSEIGGVGLLGVGPRTPQGDQKNQQLARANHRLARSYARPRPRGVIAVQRTAFRVLCLHTQRRVRQRRERRTPECVVNARSTTGVLR